MVGVHVGLDLEHKGAHLRIVRLDLALVGFLRARRRRETPKTFQEITDAEIAQRRAEIDRRHMALAERLQVEALRGFLHQFKFADYLAGIEIGVAASQIGNLDFLRCAGLGATALQQADATGFDVIGAHEIAATAHRPVDRRRVERQRLLDLVEQIKNVAAFAVHLVDEGDDRNITQAAHLDQLQRTRLDALGGVDHHDG